MKKRMEFYFYQGMLALDVTGPLDVFQAANELLSRNGKGKGGYELTFSANAPGPVSTSSGLCLHADARPGMKKIDTLLVPGGMIAETASTDSTNSLNIQMAAQKARRVVSVCSGAFLLAAAGLLDGRKATTHWMVADRLAQLYPAVHLEQDSIYVQDGNTYTSAGVTAGIDLALALVEEDYGPSLAIEVARLLLLYRRRPGNQSQFSTTLALQAKVGKRFKPLFDWAEAHLDQKLTVDQLAEKAHMSSRTFARIFPSETGMSPGRFIEQLRIDRARELLESGVEGLEQIARESGFGREERLRRAFQRRLGISPAQYRAHFMKGEQHDQGSYIRDIHL
ncbi:helix-turn-helix domain-containing protein [Pseudodesulfovibrio cashew]|uniref:Helix-turn-helix domain-containing protein n=2 Tax=Pseudodesulfovibrio cashew TaxID=2678688 RepID=A0A6I6JGK9_9BACT|nr:helix-turn-helix domain-containing protein [Pseudodesulfovibrio cashew]